MNSTTVSGSLLASRLLALTSVLASAGSGTGAAAPPAGGEEHKKSTNWDSTGAYLLAYALPFKQTFATGWKPCVCPPQNAAETPRVIAAGRDSSAC